jgi:hypothetical protein
MLSTGHAYVAVSDPAERSRIVDGLRREGWAVVERPSGFHVLSDIADVIDGACERPVKVVVDAYARGCTGKSLEEGLRDLGVQIPVQLVGL